MYIYVYCIYQDTIQQTKFTRSLCINMDKKELYVRYDILYAFLDTIQVEKYLKINGNAIYQIYDSTYL